MDGSRLHWRSERRNEKIERQPSDDEMSEVSPGMVPKAANCLIGSMVSHGFPRKGWGFWGDMM